jgi:tetratricopeptide (TPR) repeat protein
LYKKLIIFALFTAFLSCEKEPKKLRNYTSASIALNNLNSQINVLRVRVSNKKTDLLYVKKYMDLILTRMQFLSNFADIEVARSLVDLNSSELTQVEINLKYLLFAHDYNQAEIELNKINKEKPSSSKIYLRYLDAISLARGSTKLKETQDSETSNFTFGIRKANELADKGQFEDSERKLLETLNNYQGVSPFPAAYINFNLGVLWGEKGQNLKKAQSYYERAVELIPTYSSAVVHLSEIYIQQKQYKRALEILKPIASNGDPEVPATLSEIYSLLGNEKEALSYKNIADSNYKNLILKYPFAFYDHGAEFYMEIGNDPDKALLFAMANLKNRKGQRPYFLAIEAATFAKDMNQACRLQEQLNESEVTFIEYQPVYSQLKVECSSVVKK